MSASPVESYIQKLQESHEEVLRLCEGLPPEALKMSIADLQ